MGSKRPHLHVVDTATDDSPEAVLVDLFAAESQQLALLASTRRLIDDAVARYAEAHQLLMRPRTELLRTRYAPSNDGNQP